MAPVLRDVDLDDDGFPKTEAASKAFQAHIGEFFADKEKAARVLEDARMTSPYNSNIPTIPEPREAVQAEYEGFMKKHFKKHNIQREAPFDIKTICEGSKHYLSYVAWMENILVGKTTKASVLGVRTTALDSLALSRIDGFDSVRTSWKKTILSHVRYLAYNYGFDKENMFDAMEMSEEDENEDEDEEFDIWEMFADHVVVRYDSEGPEPDPTAVRDTDGRITFWNPATKRSAETKASKAKLALSHTTEFDEASESELEVPAKSTKRRKKAPPQAKHETGNDMDINSSPGNKSISRLAKPTRAVQSALEEEEELPISAKQKARKRKETSLGRKFD